MITSYSQVNPETDETVTVGDALIVFVSFFKAATDAAVAKIGIIIIKHRCIHLEIAKYFQTKIANYFRDGSLQ